MQPSNISEVHRPYPSLFHYTNAGGLEGIVRNRTLWARHTAFLNDSEEIVGFYERVLKRYFLEILQPHEAEIRARAPTDKPLAGLIEDLVRRDLTLTNDRNDFYSLSFCTADDPFVLQNGLLSQWRGYGNDGGYALEFSTSRIEELLKLEQARNSAEHIYFAPVSYTYESLVDSSNTTIQRSLGVLKDWLRGALPTLPSADIFESQVLAGFFKHIGFHEEREVRVVVTQPGAKTKVERLIPPGHMGAIRSPQAFVKGGTPIPYLALFKDATEHWNFPLTRVIVGPHADKEARRRAVDILLKSQRLVDVKVEVSEIPYRG